MTVRSRCAGLLLAIACCFSVAAALAQTNAPVMGSFSVDQVAELAPGAELVFRVGGTPGGAVSLKLDGVANLIGLPETRPGSYEGAYTISIKDKVRFNSKAVATLKVGDRAVSAALAQPLLNAEAHARAVAAASPPPVAAPQIQRMETGNSGALSGGHEISFVVNGSAAAKVSVSMDGGVLGGVLGNQVGGGTGKTVATVVGTVGGAVAGNEIEKNVRSETHYDVAVKLDNGSTRTVRFQAEPVFKVGAKVKLSGDTLVPND